jgi:PAS domain S-box-containing protein/putative nucleotidyltransferase with HDIG domain
MSLRAKLITLILFFILPTIGLMVFFHTRLVSAYQEQTLVFQNSAANMVSGALRNLVNDARNTLHSASESEGNLLESKGCKNYIDHITGEGDYFYSLVIADVNGNIRCASKNFDQSRRVAAIPAFQEVIGKDDYAISDLPVSGQEEKPELIMAYPIHNKLGELSGVLIGMFNPARLAIVFEELNLPPAAEVYVFNQNSQVLFSPTLEDKPTQQALIDNVKANLQGRNLSNKEVIVKSTDSTERIFRFVSLDLGQKEMVGVGFPQGRFITESEQFVSGNVAIISLLSLTIIILVYGGIETSLIRPLAIITQTADSLARGDFSKRTNLGKHNDEIGRLGLIFDRMADSIQESRLSLEAETSAKLASQEKFFRLFEDSILGIFQVDKEGILIEINTALAKMFGYTSDEEMIKTMNDPAGTLFLDKADDEKIVNSIKQRKPVQMETQFRKSDGSYFDGNLHIWGVWSATGELESMEGFVEDITVNKQTQNQLMKLIQAVEQNPIGIVISDGKGNIEYANPGMESVFGFRPEELIGKTILSLVSESISIEELNLIRQAVRNGTMYRGEVKSYKKNGEQFWERFVVSPISNSQEKTTNTLCLMEDVTEQNRNKDRIIKQVEELSALRTIDLAISSNLDLLATLNIIANLAVKHLSVDAVCIQLYDSQFHILHTAVKYGFSKNIPDDIPFPAAADLSDWELVEEFSIHVPENLSKNKSSHRLPFPVDDRFSACFGLPLVAKAEVKGLFRVFLKDPFNPVQHWLDFFYNLATQTAVAMDNYELFRNLKQSNTDLLQAYEATIEGWSKALNYRDQETEDHSIRTTKWTIELATEMGYPTDELKYIRRGALLHDIGKVAVPDNILNKPGPLTDEEWIQMRKHPQAAFEVLSPIKFLEKSLDIPYCHHECWNGMGYPRGLQGQEIPLAARIFSVIDVFDALTSDRPYRPAWPEEKVILYLREQSGTQFDPEVVEAFLVLLEKQKVN